MRLSASDGGRLLRELDCAARFFTRLPRGTASLEPDSLARAAWAFPVVGGGIGLWCGAVALAAGGLGLLPLASALLAVGAGVMATGALHEDGLADAADGLAGRDADECLALMRDSRDGTYAVLALVFSVGLRAAAVSVLPGGAALAAFVAAHAIGRGGLPAVMLLLQPARSDGLGAAAGRPGPGETAAALIIAVAIAFAALGLVAGIIALVLAGLVMAGITALAERRIGGHTGDILGAIEQGGETVVLLVASAWAW